jgi:hypothetical protein
LFESGRWEEAYDLFAPIQEQVEEWNSRPQDKSCEKIWVSDFYLYITRKYAREIFLLSLEREDWPRVRAILSEGRVFYYGYQVMQELSHARQKTIISHLDPDEHQAILLLLRDEELTDEELEKEATRPSPREKIIRFLACEKFNWGPNEEEENIEFLRGLCHFSKGLPVSDVLSQRFVTWEYFPFQGLTFPQSEKELEAYVRFTLREKANVNTNKVKISEKLLFRLFQYPNLVEKYRPLIEYKANYFENFEPFEDFLIESEEAIRRRLREVEPNSSYFSVNLGTQNYQLSLEEFALYRLGVYV